MKTTWQNTIKTLGAAALATMVLSTVAWSEPPEQTPGKGLGRGLQQGRGPQQGREEWQDPDTDGDGLVSSSEADAAIQQMTQKLRERFEQRNQRVLQAFDKDGDGTLNAEELARAKAMRERIQERRQDGDGPGNAEGKMRRERPAKGDKGAKGGGRGPGKTNPAEQP